MPIRKLEKEDYNKGYLSLLEQLTKVGKIYNDDFNNTLEQLSSNYHICVIEEKGQIIATGTLLIEQKIIHECGKVGHIEDIVVHNDYNGKGYGKQIINHLTKLAEENGCYKVILDCSLSVKSFYEKCGFKEKGIQMAIYFEYIICKIICF